MTVVCGFDCETRVAHEVVARAQEIERIHVEKPSMPLTTVVLPMILPYLISGFAFAFVLSLNEHIVAYMTLGFTLETLPIKIFNALRYGYTPTMASVSILFVVVAALVFSLIARYGDLPRLLGALSRDDR